NFCVKNNLRICLDVSHSKLACNFMKKSFSEFVKNVAPFVAHMHLADAKGVDGEGLQITDGEIDWPLFMDIVNRETPNASFIPEIWQGHKNDGEGAWKALEALSQFA
ncbi:MAG: acetylneuraminic acid synthetase, partial [Elusimicrobia bacterium]